ncbi:hypothetical protein WM93_16085 [Klebsiella pneumoniae]|nr:hypothetical protein WM93_16085 [Klebsiella pneumoniae]
MHYMDFLKSSTLTGNRSLKVGDQLQKIKMVFFTISYGARFHQMLVIRNQSLSYRIILFLDVLGLCIAQKFKDVMPPCLLERQTKYQDQLV